MFNADLKSKKYELVLIIKRELEIYAMERSCVAEDPQTCDSRSCGDYTKNDTKGGA